MTPSRQRPLVWALCLLSLSSGLSAAPKIGLLLKGRSDFWSAVEKGARSTAAKLGVDLVVKAPPSETDVAVQIRLLSALGAQGIDALVIAPTNRRTLAGPVAALAARGVKVVVIDSPLDGSGSQVFVGTDQRAAGEAAGRMLAALIGDHDEVSVLQHSQDSTAALERAGGATAALRTAHPGLAIHADIYASSEDGAEPQRCAFLLSKYPETKAIIAAGTPGTMAMLRILRARPDAGAIKFVGFGFNLNPEVEAAIADGAMDGWVAQLPEDVGSKGVRAAVDLLAGRAVAPVISTDFIVVTKDNLRQPAVQALLGAD